MHILLLSAYDANSHQYWRSGLRQHFQDYQFTELVLPSRFFNWRIRGNGLYWSFAEHDVLTQSYDLILATSMVDLATLRGLVPQLCQIPTVLYFHENQFAYPMSSSGSKAQEQGKADAVAAMMVQLYSALAADKVLFNSEYNRRSFIDGLQKLLRQLPDYVPQGVAESITAKSQILHVPLSDTPPAGASLSVPERETNSEQKSYSILWNHRWEYDKGPERLLHCLRALPATEQFTVHVVGQSFRQVPSEFAEIRQLLERNGWLGNWGYMEDSASYHALLASARMVLSTAVHDFQGLSVLEAVQAHCLPVVPNRLAYQELFSSDFRYEESTCLEKEGENAAAMILRLSRSEIIPPSLHALTWSQLGPAYRELFERLAFEF
ncbi:hypothetical protein TDB9533_02155 [Thalassocella blandensis]|nr:hypothetical protein TDB9533_02155 [Thalassocella blandensis]